MVRSITVAIFRGKIFLRSVLRTESNFSTVFRVSIGHSKCANRIYHGSVARVYRIHGNPSVSRFIAATRKKHEELQPLYLKTVHDLVNLDSASRSTN